MLKKTAFSILLCLWLAAGFAQDKKMTVQEYIDTYKELAVGEMERARIPASITLAQGILESANGNSRLATEGNNHFGIKCKKNWTGNTIYADDDELHECFRAYATAKESYVDHSTFLIENARYAFLFDLEITDYKGWAKGLKQAGYATNPQYAEILIGLIERHELHKLDKNEPLPKKGDEIKPKPDPIVQAAGELFRFNGIPATKVMEGQTAISIAQVYGLLPRQFYRYNDMKEGSDVVPGSIVYLKPKHRKGSEAYHTVKTGETMYSISQLYGVKLKHLYNFNRMKEDTEPAIGQIVYLRRKRRTPPELRIEGAETIIRIPFADTLKTEPYIERPEVVIKPNDPAPKKEKTKKEEPVEQAPVAKEEKKPVFVEKKTDEKYDVQIEEKNKEYRIDKKQLDNVEYHVVQKGETLFAIARKYGKSVEQLKQLNHLSDFGLKEGQKIIVNQNFKEKEPDTKTTDFYHEVQKGETLFSIAKKYNMTVDELKKLNNLGDSPISVGTRLVVSKAEVKSENTKSETVTTNFTYHTVAQGETLYAIARKYGVKVDDIKKLNNLGDGAIKPGDKLRVK
ncbi:MAG: LysM peptidoglycan-binding domain-containing protein [Bacteroidetes bacterium]|nr:MAG: LysM peptidoglycan-binding domain-containing protein [Bacteroidota bacterium]